MGRTYRALVITFKVSALVICVVILLNIVVTFLQQMKFQPLILEKSNIFDQWWLINKTSESPQYRNAVKYDDLNRTTIFNIAPQPEYNDIVSVIQTEREKEYNVETQPLRDFVPLTSQDIHSIKRFVFFVGYSRSGHSIVASMLDAHPNMIIAHEYNLFRELARNRKKISTRALLYNRLYSNSYNNAVKGWRSERRNQKGYTLQMNATWQGAFEKLLVIGEKAGAVTAQQYADSPTRFAQLYLHLQELTAVPIRVVHVVRNPYDMISTRLLYSDCDKARSKLNATREHKYRHISHMQQHINRSFAIAENVHQIITDPKLNLTVLEIHNIDFVEDTKTIMLQLCWFLGVECSEDYLKMCSDKAYSSVSRTRYLVEWPTYLIEEVEQRMQPYRYFWRYAFNQG